MEQAVENLELMFRKAETDLKYISRKLDFQLENDEEVTAKNNPLKLMKKLEEVKAEYANLVEDTEAIQEAQKEFVDFFRSQLLSLTQLLQALETQTNSNPEADAAMDQLAGQLGALMGVPKESLIPSEETSLSSVTACQTPGTDSLSVSSSSSSTSQNSVDAVSLKNKEVSNGAESAVCSTSEPKRKNSTEFPEVSQEEFQSVSSLIRGRVKLEDVNKTYEALWQHFKVDQNQDPLTPKEMNALGLRITGKTGEAKLKVLRALKLCDISKTGDVRLF